MAEISPVSELDQLRQQVVDLHHRVEVAEQERDEARELVCKSQAREVQGMKHEDQLQARCERLAEILRSYQENLPFVAGIEEYKGVVEIYADAHAALQDLPQKEEK